MGDWGAAGWNPSSSACGRVGPGLKLRPEGWQDEEGKIIPPGGRQVGRGCHREGVVKRREGERED